MVHGDIKSMSFVANHLFFVLSNDYIMRQIRSHNFYKTFYLDFDEDYSVEINVFIKERI